MHELLAKGVGISAIAETLGLDRKTVRRYAHAATPGTWRPPRADGADHASTRSCPTCTSGGTRAARMLPGRSTRSAKGGYTGGRRTVRRHLQDVRASGKPVPQGHQQLSSAAPEAVGSVVRPR
ncbi:hypothetical protein [Actinomadura sp. 3N407]|uniref:hypothetical protein n=1 Tax=Actinomadura sp. 3N407 TaxID=3457423 RepID=UPI003FCDEB03